MCFILVELHSGRSLTLQFGRVVPAPAVTTGPLSCTLRLQHQRVVNSVSANTSRGASWHPSWSTWSGAPSLSFWSFWHMKNTWMDLCSVAVFKINFLFVSLCDNKTTDGWKNSRKIAPMKAPGCALSEESEQWRVAYIRGKGLFAHWCPFYIFTSATLTLTATGWNKRMVINCLLLHSERDMIIWYVVTSCIFKNVLYSYECFVHKMNKVLQLVIFLCTITSSSINQRYISIVWQ